MSKRDILLSATLAADSADFAVQANETRIHSLAETITALGNAGAAIVSLSVTACTRPVQDRIEDVRYLLSALEKALPDNAPMVFLSTEFLGAVGMQTRFDAIRAIRPKGVDLVFREIFSDESDEGFSRLKGFFRWLKVMEVVPRFIMRSPSDLARFVRLRVFDVVTFARPYVLFELGANTDGEKTDDTATLHRFLEALDHQPVIWAACTHGQDEAAVIFHSLLEGGHVHVGLACNRLLPDGTMAERPEDPVHAARDIIQQTGNGLLQVRDLRIFLKDSFKEYT